MFAPGFPFENGPCFARASGTGSCHASAQAFAGPGGPAFPFGRRAAGGPAFPFGNASAFESDMVDTPEAYLIYFDATGFERGDVHVKVVDKTLKLSAKKGEAVSVERAWAIPEDVLLDEVTAKFSNKELTITLPRVPQEPKDADGSWVEVADEDVKRAKEKGKAASDAHVLEDADN
ncbi:hypothetical protein WJX73_007906 [Symbiochloris irregularis]|uniref:SHSP domain-containing protein n=1 Tax=Symbiochloris irregularis TaxID=706552 RepID=A0AAW1PNG8_9CHLO